MTTRKYGARVETAEWLKNLFESEEGTIDQYYGRIGNGKTYNATADIFNDLKHGLVVYANWIIDFPGYDERDSFWKSFIGALGLKRHFYLFPKENLYFFQMSDSWAQKQGYEDFMAWFASRTDCKIYIDEGHLLFDSYQGTKMSLEKRASLLHTRHFNRTIAIISQRPTAIHVSARANVNRFFKCEKIMSWPFLIFRKTEFQDMASTGETVDEEATPLSSKWYFASSKILRAYNTKYLRGGIPLSQEVAFTAFFLTFKERLQQFGVALTPGWALRFARALRGRATAFVASRGTKERPEASLGRIGANKHFIALKARYAKGEIKPMT